MPNELTAERIIHIFENSNLQGRFTPEGLTAAYVAALAALHAEQERMKGCADCTGIIYRQTKSKKLIPADKRCAVVETPPCYQPDGDGCAYQTYGDSNDEPIDKCKECPLCYSDKVRRPTEGGCE